MEKNMMKRIAPVLILLSLCLTPCLPAQERHLDVPYVPTKYPVVDAMLSLANVQKSDTLIDLGCGDGRIVVAGAQKYGARAIGVDIDPDRIQESHENAAKAGVKDHVKFIQGDLFQAEIREASVVSLYLLTSVNLKLRPRLIRELRPGTRVVSHNFGMDDWKPDDTKEVMVDEISHDVFLWIIPANASGTWKWTMAEPKTSWEMNIEQLFQKISGSLSVSGASASLKDAVLTGDKIKFTADRQVNGKTDSFVFEGVVRGHTIAGKVLQNGKELGEWKASRNPSTQKDIDAGSSPDIRY
jgi:ubiquinone/menaquinone biosynthesis C-methylase UbiE